MKGAAAPRGTAICVGRAPKGSQLSTTAATGCVRLTAGTHRYGFWGFEASNHAVAEGIEGKHSHPSMSVLSENMATVTLAAVLGDLFTGKEKCR